MSAFSEEEIAMFVAEADELMDAAEKSVLLVDKGEELRLHYDSIFRALHSIKGAAGMMEMTKVQNHMHQLETLFVKQGAIGTLDRPFADLLLRGFDATRNLLKGIDVDFDYSLKAEAPVALTIVSAAKPQEETRISVGRIVVVDDEPEIVDLLTDILMVEGIEVRGVTNPKDVLQTIAEFKPDAVFSDIMMPGLSGLDLLGAISKLHPDMPVIFISGYVDKKSLLEAIHLGVFSVIEKPFDNLRVAECALNAIEKSKLRKMVNQSINLLMFQFSDLSDFLKSHGRDEAHQVISNEISTLVRQRRALMRKKTQKAA